MSSAPRQPSDRFRQQRVTVMGLGAFGGGEGAVRFLCDRGARVTITDLQCETELAATLSRLADCRLAGVHLGGHREDDFQNADLVVVNPAVQRDSPWLAVARAAGVPLTSEMNLLVEHNAARVLAITGSVGKSTTTSMTEQMLATAGRHTWLGGNIGRSLLPVVDQIGSSDWVVLELSSFQLADLDRIQFRPHVAVVTNFRSNHLDWHGSLAAYRHAKQALLRWQTADDFAVVNSDDADVAIWPGPGRRIRFGRSAAANVRIMGRTVLAATGAAPFEIDLQSATQLAGAHQIQNAAAAIAAATAAGADANAIRAALAEFRGLPHRLQFLGEHRGRRFYDDSKATTPEAAIAALTAFEAPVVLLAGGSDKQVDLAEFGTQIALRAKAAVLMGTTAQRLAEHVLTVANGGPHPVLLRPDSFDTAFRLAISASAPGDVVLLSPGCASYGWFPNYVARGEAFSRHVAAWAAEPG